MTRLYKFLISEGFITEVYYSELIEMYHPKKRIRLTVEKQSGSWYNTKWEVDGEEYYINAKRQQFIFDELKKFGFERGNDI